MSNGNHPEFEVYSFVPPRHEHDKKRWNRIGAAWINRDGSINIALNATPLTPELQLRQPIPEETEQDKEA